MWHAESEAFDFNVRTAEISVKISYMDRQCFILLWSYLFALFGDVSSAIFCTMSYWHFIFHTVWLHNTYLKTIKKKIVIKNKPIKKSYLVTPFPKRHFQTHFWPDVVTVSDSFHHKSNFLSLLQWPQNTGHKWVSLRAHTGQTQPWIWRLDHLIVDCGCFEKCSHLSVEGWGS